MLKYEKEHELVIKDEECTRVKELCRLMLEDKEIDEVPSLKSYIQDVQYDLDGTE